MPTFLGRSAPCRRSGKTLMVIRERDIQGEVDGAGEHRTGMRSGRDGEAIADVRGAANDQGDVDGGDGLVQQQRPLVGRWSNTMPSLPREHGSEDDVCSASVSMSTQMQRVEMIYLMGQRQGIRTVNVDAERCRVGDDEVDNRLLVEAGGVTVRADIIVVRGDAAIASASMPTALSSTTTNTSNATNVKITFLPLIFMFSLIKLILS